MREELLKSVTKDTSLNQCLEFAQCVEGNMQSEELSKKVGDIILDPQSVKVDAIKHKKAKHSQTTHRTRMNTDDEMWYETCQKEVPSLWERVFSVW